MEALAVNFIFFEDRQTTRLAIEGPCRTLKIARKINCDTIPAFSSDNSIKRNIVFSEKYYMDAAGKLLSNLIVKPERKTTMGKRPLR